MEPQLKEEEEDEEAFDEDIGEDVEMGGSLRRRPRPSSRVVLRQKSDCRPKEPRMTRRRSASFRKVMKQRKEAEAMEEKVSSLEAIALTSNC